MTPAGWGALGGLAVLVVVFAVAWLHGRASCKTLEADRDARAFAAEAARQKARGDLARARPPEEVLHETLEDVAGAARGYGVDADELVSRR